jgi:hypothetical protein
MKFGSLFLHVYRGFNVSEDRRTLVHIILERKPPSNFRVSQSDNAQIGSLPLIQSADWYNGGDVDHESTKK